MSTGLDFVIIGAQKGGSTLVADALGHHPDVWMPPREVALFRDPLFSEGKAAELRRWIVQSSSCKLAGIKCPDYLARAEVPPRLLDQDKPPQLVLSLRDPVSRAISTYFWHVRWGLLPLEDPSVGLKKVIDGVYSGSNPRAHEIMSWSLYGSHLSHYLEYFKRDQIHVLFSEDLRVAPNETLRDVFRFLNVDDTVSPVLRANAANEGAYSKARLRFLRLRNRYVQWWDPQRTYVDVRPATGFLPKLVSWSVAGTDRYVLARVFRNGKPDIDPAVLRGMREFFVSDVEVLESIIGRDLGRWKS